MFYDFILAIVLAGLIALIAYVASLVVSFYNQDQISRSDPLAEGKETSYVFPVSYVEAEAYESAKADMLKQALNVTEVSPQQFLEFARRLPDSDRVSITCLFATISEKAQGPPSKATYGHHHPDAEATG